MLADARMGGFFQPETVEADFAYWAKMPEWTEREAAALLCGLNPYYVAKLKPVTSRMDRQLHISASWN
jgi:hypothetical protein